MFVFLVCGDINDFSFPPMAIYIVRIVLCFVSFDLDYFHHYDER